MRKILFILPLLLFASAAQAQSGCSGQAASGALCGNSAASQGLPSLTTATSIFDRSFGSTSGMLLNRGVSNWSATSTPTLGRNGGTGGSILFNGSTSGAATFGVRAAAGAVTFNLPNTNGSLNNVLITDGSGNTSWTTAGAGTVSSVGLALPASTFTVSGSPVTGTGTLTGAFANQSANTVLAGPNTGAATTPTWRALVGADLPNPSTSSLGGTQAINAIASNWIRSISTSGVPALSQPAFTDISGTLAPAQCPNPSASTIGCIESFAAQSSKWINTISTSGVPSATQPAFSDISGSITPSQLPSISGSSILGNATGGTAVPTAITTSQALDFIGAVQGDVLYRNASSWVVLPPGTGGQVLTTGGAAANPTWTSVSGTGTVTSVATNNGLTGGTITTSGTVGLATIATGNALAYTGGGTGVPVATTPSTLLDVIGSTTGNLLYRAAGGTGWQVLAPGTNGQVLTQGASTPAWGSAGTVSNVTVSAGTGVAATGTCNISTTGTCTVALSAARQTLPTNQKFITGSGTYTTPANVLWIEIYFVGGGGGGGGSGSGAGTASNATATCWNTSGSACSTPVYSLGGGNGGGGNGNAGGSGGTVSGSGTFVWSVSGGGGSGGGTSQSGITGSVGGVGGASFFAGAGSGGAQNTVGGTAATNSGSGGGGAGLISTVSQNSGGGGGSGAAGYAIIQSPAATYTYAIGAGTSGGAAGTSGQGGGTGADGRIFVIEHYGS